MLRAAYADAALDPVVGGLRGGARHRYGARRPDRGRRPRPRRGPRPAARQTAADGFGQDQLRPHGSAARRQRRSPGGAVDTARRDPGLPQLHQNRTRTSSSPPTACRSPPRPPNGRATAVTPSPASPVSVSAAPTPTSSSANPPHRPPLKPEEPSRDEEPPGAGLFDP